MVWEPAFQAKLRAQCCRCLLIGASRTPATQRSAQLLRLEPINEISLKAVTDRLCGIANATTPTRAVVLLRSRFAAEEQRHLRRIVKLRTCRDNGFTPITECVHRRKLGLRYEP